MSQTITTNDGNVSLYVFDDSVQVDLSATPNTTVRNNGGNDFDIGDLNASNATLHSGVTAPDGWAGGKHTYDGSSWGNVSGCCLLYTSPSPRDRTRSRMPSSA